MHLVTATDVNMMYTVNKTNRKLANTTLRGPCIMIYSYYKSQQDALFLEFFLIKNSYTFRTDLLSIIRSLNTVYTAIGICHASYVDCLLVRSGWNASSQQT